MVGFLLLLPVLARRTAVTVAPQGLVQQNLRSAHSEGAKAKAKHEEGCTYCQGHGNSHARKHCFTSCNNKIAAAAQKMYQDENAVATRAQAAVAQSWNTESNLAINDVMDAMNSLKDQQVSYESQSEVLQSQVSTSLERTAAEIPPIERLAEAAEAETEKSVEKQTKDAEKAFKTIEDKAEKDLDHAADRTDKMIEESEKATEKEGKQNDRDVGKLESKAEKEIAKEDKAAEKEQGKAAAVSEKMDEKITEEEDKNLEINSHLSEVADAADGTMEQAQAAQEYAFEQTEALNEKYEENLDKKMEEVQAEGAIAAGEVSKALQDSVKESMNTVSQAASQTGESLNELRKQTEQSVKDTEVVLKENEKELAGAQKEQEVESKKLENQLMKTESIEQGNKDKAGELLAALKEQITEMIQKNKDTAMAEIAEHGDQLAADVTKKKESALSEITKGSDQILSDADLAASQIAEQFQGDYETMGNKLAKVQRDFDNTKNQVHADAKQTASNIEQLQKLDATAGPELTKFAEQSIRSQQHIKEQADADQEDVLNVLAASLGQATEQVKNDAAGARKSITDAYNQLSTETDNAEEQIVGKANEITSQYAATMKDVDAVLKPTEAQQSAAQSQLKQVNEDLSTIYADAGKMKETYSGQLAAVQDRIMQASEKLNQDTQKRFEEDEAYASEHMTQLEQSLSQILGQQQANFDQQAAGVGSSIKDAEDAEDVRRKLEMDKINKLSNEINVQDTRVKDQEEKFLPEYKTMMATVQAAMAKIQEIQKASAASREAFQADMKEKTGEKVASLQDEVLKLLDDGVKQTSAQTENLGKDLMQQESQAEAETQGTMKNIDSSLQNTVALYKEIMGKVMKLEETEKGMNGDEWLKRAQSAVAMMQKDQVDRTAQVSKLEAEYAAGQAKANEEINQFQQDRSAERQQFTNSLLQAIDGIEKKRKEAKEALDSKMQSMDSDARVAAGKIDADQAKMQESIGRGMDAVKDSEQAGLRNIEGMERQVEGKTAEEMRALNEMSLDTAKKRTQEQAEQAEVQRDLSAEQRAVGAEVGAMQNAVGGMLKNLDPTAQLGVVTQSINSIQGLMDHAQETEQAKVSEVENDVKVTSNKIEKILAAANLEGGVLSKAVMATAMEVRDKLSTLKTQLAGEQQELRSLAQETFHTAQDLSSAHTRRIESLQHKMDGTREQLEKALGLQKYQSGEALEKVLFVLNKAIQVDQGLIHEKDTVILPSTQEWRGQVERVFEGLNMALDLERVERMAQMSLAAEEADGSGMMTAKEKMDKEIAMIQKRMQNEIDFVRAKAQKMIAEIEADASLSDAEKKARIAAIRKQADADVYKLTMRTRKLISDQYMSGHKLDEEINELHNLLERAKHIAGQGTAESAAWAKAMMQEVRKRIDSLRERYVNNYSFVQIDQMVKDAGDSVDRLAARKAAFAEAGSELASMAQERESEDASWNKALDALEMGTKLFQKQKAAQ